MLFLVILRLRPATRQQEYYTPRAFDAVLGRDTSVKLPAQFSEDFTLDHLAVPLLSRSGSSLPVELVEDIIGHLQGDMAALASCSSVCRYWYPYSHVTLYTSIHIHKSSGSTALAQLAYHSPHVRDDLACTRELVIVGDTTCKSQFTDSILLLFATVHDHLDSLILQGSLQLPIPPALTTSLRLFEGVTYLELSDFEVYNIHELIRVISAPPSLVRVSLIRGRMTHPSGTSYSWVQRTAVRVSQRLHELHLSDLQASLLSSIVNLLQSIYSFRQTRLFIVDEGLETVGDDFEEGASSVNPQQLFKVHHQYSFPSPRFTTTCHDMLLEFAQGDERPVLILRRWHLLPDSIVV